MNEDCMELFEKMSQYLDGELDGELVVFAESHLEKCVGCEENLELMKKSIQMIRTLSREEIPENVRIGLREAIEKEKERGKTS